MPIASPAQDALDACGIDGVCDLILGGHSYQKIADGLGVGLTSVLRWLSSDPEYSARAREARLVTAAHWDQQAEVEIRDAADTPEGVAKARELASHFRWRSSKLDRKGYGDKLDLNHGGNIGITKAPIDPSVLDADDRAFLEDILLRTVPTPTSGGEE